MIRIDLTDEYGRGAEEVFDFADTDIVAANAVVRALRALGFFVSVTYVLGVAA